jgi:hypothetical protein
MCLQVAVFLCLNIPLCAYSAALSEEDDTYSVIGLFDGCPGSNLAWISYLHILPQMV